MARFKFIDIPRVMSEDAIKARLTATLQQILRRKGEAKVRLDYAEKGRINRRAATLAGRQAERAGLDRLRKEERERILAAVDVIDLVMAGDEDWADRVAAALHAEMPWMAPATEHAWSALRRAARLGGAIAMRPVLLDGPPGIGKSVWARRLAAHLALPVVDIDASKAGAGFAVAGLERGWGSSLPGRPLEAILGGRIANPVVVVDEICKAKRAFSEKGSAFSLADALLSLMEPETARSWECPHYRLRFDMSHILWVMTANDVSLVPAPLRSRTAVVTLAGPTPAQMADVVMAEGRRRGLSEESVGAILDALARAGRMLGRQFSLRDIQRMLERAEELEERPRVQ